MFSRLFKSGLRRSVTKQKRKERKARRESEQEKALIAEELRQQSLIAPLDNLHEPVIYCTRSKLDTKSWLRYWTKRTAKDEDAKPRNLRELPGELQNSIINFLDPVSLALLRLTCKHFYRIIPAPSFINCRHIENSHVLRCLRFSFLSTVYDKDSSIVPPNWHYHSQVCGKKFYPCTGCKDFHHIEWFAPYRLKVLRYPALQDRPQDCRACVQHTRIPEMLYSPDLWPRLARARGWVVSTISLCECCGKYDLDPECVKEPCECGCRVCRKVAIDYWKTNGRAIVLYRK